MNSKHCVPTLLACALALASPFARSACDTADAAKVTVALIMADMQAAGDRNRAAVDASLRALNTKAALLGWDWHETTAFMNAVNESSEVQGYLQKKLQAAVKVRPLQQRLNAIDANRDPIQACKVAIELEPLMRDMLDLAAQGIAVIASRIEAAR